VVTQLWYGNVYNVVITGKVTLDYYGVAILTS